MAGTAPEKRQAGPARSAAVVLAALSLLCAAPAADEGFDRAELESAEELSESLANDLLALSVALRDRDDPSVPEYLTETVSGTPLPIRPSELRPVRKWIHRHGWAEDPAPDGPVSREGVLDRLRALLAHFSELEDVRLKVQAAEFTGSGPVVGRGQIKFFVIGRDRDGRREWLRARLRIVAGRGSEGPWRIREIHVESIESLVALVDLFSEVATPAGVLATFPPFGVGPNQGFFSHGVAVADVNGDGLLDVAATGVENNVLYLNGGDGRFRDVSEDSLVGFAPAGTGAVFLDYDQDGDPDLFLAAAGDQILLQNRWIPDGALRFWDVSERAGVKHPAVGFGATAGDVNGDGLPDVYVASYNRYGYVMPNSWDRATNGTPNLLFVNQGDGTFREAAGRWGARDDRWSYAAAFADLDRDGDLDLYVANDFGENAFYRNEGNRFRDMAEAFGLKDPGFGMGVSFGDYDNDGDLDLHVTNMSSTAGARILQRIYPERAMDELFLAKLAAGNSLYENRGGGAFRDVSAQVGGFSGGWAFGGGFVDFDNDGWEDLYTPNGFISGKSMKDT